LLLPGDALGHFHRHRARCEQDGMARELIGFPIGFRGALVADARNGRFFEIVVILARKQIPLFLKML
jgi:hypothetical protein